MPLAFAAMAQSVVVLSRGIDLSVGSVMALTNVIAAKMMMDEKTLGSALAISALVLVIGIVIGTINGLAVVYSRVPDIVATLALSFVWAGVALIVLPTPGGGSPVGFQDLSTQATLSEWVPNGLLVLAGVVPGRLGPAALAAARAGDVRGRQRRHGRRAQRRERRPHADPGLHVRRPVRGVRRPGADLDHRHRQPAVGQLLHADLGRGGGHRRHQPRGRQGRAVRADRRGLHPLRRGHGAGVRGRRRELRPGHPGRADRAHGHGSADCC